MFNVYEELYITTFNILLKLKHLSLNQRGLVTTIRCHVILFSFVQDMLVAGTDTTYTTLEWTISELLKHPKGIINMSCLP